METIRAARLRRTSTTFLQGVLVLFGVGVAAFLLCEPHFEGRNAHATFFEVYFKDPFLAYAYTASVPFFLALYHGFQVLGIAGRDEMVSPSAVHSLRIIRRCALAVIGFVVGGVVFLVVNSGDSDDGPPAVVMGAAVTFASIVVAAFVTTLERILQQALDLKAENDLTV